MTIVLIVNAFLAGLVCFAVIGGLASSIAPECVRALHRPSRRAALRRATTLTVAASEASG